MKFYSRVWTSIEKGNATSSKFATSTGRVKAVALGALPVGAVAGDTRSQDIVRRPQNLNEKIVRKIFSAILESVEIKDI